MRKSGFVRQTLTGLFAAGLSLTWLQPAGAAFRDGVDLKAGGGGEPPDGPFGGNDPFYDLPPNNVSIGQLPEFQRDSPTRAPATVSCVAPTISYPSPGGELGLTAIVAVRNGPAQDAAPPPVNAALMARQNLAFDQADANKDGWLSRDEFNMTLPGQGNPQAFDRADIDRNGYVSREEFMAPLAGLGPFAPAGIAANVVSQPTDVSDGVVRVSGEITNTGKRAAAVPPIWITTVGPRGRPLEEKQAVASDRTTIPAGGSLPFVYDLKVDTPDMVSRVTVAFTPKGAGPAKVCNLVNLLAARRP